MFEGHPVTSSRSLLRARTAIVALAVVLGAYGESAPATDAAPGAATLGQPANWAWRRVVERQIQNPTVAVAPQARPADLSPLLVHAAPDTDLVQLPEMRVSGNRVVSQLEQLYRKQDAQARTDRVNRNAGIGVHTVRLGPLNAGVATVFYVPIFASVELSW